MPDTQKGTVNPWLTQNKVALLSYLAISLLKSLFANAKTTSVGVQD
jgi:hypothetical protein